MKLILVLFFSSVVQSSFAQASVVSGADLANAMRQFSGSYIEVGGAYNGMWKSSVTNGTNGIQVDDVSQLAVVNGYCILSSVSVTNSDRLGTLFYCIAR